MPSANPEIRRRSSSLSRYRWRSPRFLTRTCRREDQTRAKPNIRPVNIVHPSSPSNGLLHVLKFVIQHPPPAPSSQKKVTASHTERQYCQDYSSPYKPYRLRYAPAVAPARDGGVARTTPAQQVTGVFGIWVCAGWSRSHLQERKICFMGRQREGLRFVVGSPRTAPARSAFRGWPEGVPVFPMSAFLG